MNKLTVIVEGLTEQAFVRDQLDAHLARFNIKAFPILPGTNTAIEVESETGTRPARILSRS